MFKQFYNFGPDILEWGLDGEPAKDAKRILGGKGAALVDMLAAGLPVPPGYTITTEACNEYRACANPTTKSIFIDSIVAESMMRYGGLQLLFGYFPLVSVRSGAPISMPGMMDTILNVGLTSANLPEWCDRIGDRAALDSYRRLIQMLGSTAYGVPHVLFEEALHLVKEDAAAIEDSELAPFELEEVIGRYLLIFKKHTGEDFPNTPEQQLRAAIVAVFDSWMNERAIVYRKMNNIDDAMGTAVTVQTMVFGNMGDTSGSGVLFTRDPSTGENVVMAEYLPDAQGEDVVAGIRTPVKLDVVKQETQETDTWKSQLGHVCHLLEATYRDMVDVEFTVQENKLYILQSRAGKRSAQAALKIAVDLASEGLIPEQVAIRRVTHDQFVIASRPNLAPGFNTPPTLVGLPASPGVVSGDAVYSSAEAVAYGKPCILVTVETTPDDIAGMNAAVGILTQTGGATSHAAVVARAMDTPCVVGCHDLKNHGYYSKRKVTIDGSTGNVWFDIDVPTVGGDDSEAIQEFANMCARNEPTYVAVDWLDAGTALHRMALCAMEWWGDFDTLALVLDEYKNLEDETGVCLDLRSPVELSRAEDKVLYDLFGVPDDTEFVNLVLTYLRETPGFSGLAIICPKATPEWVEHMAEVGINVYVSRPPTNIRDILAGHWDADPEFINKVVGDATTWAGLKELLAQSGIQAIELPQIGSRNSVVARALRAGEV